MKRSFVLASLAAMILAGCSSAPPTEREKMVLDDQAPYTLKMMETRDDGLAPLLANSYGYAIFPNIGKGGLIAGGASGRGVVFERGVQTGYADFSQATIGGQIGGQTVSELVVLEDAAAMERFKSGKLTFETNLSAVALDRGTAHAANYRNGVIAFVHSQGGLMAEATIGGQQFTFIPKGTSMPTTNP